MILANAVLVIAGVVTFVVAAVLRERARETTVPAALLIIASFALFAFGVPGGTGNPLILLALGFGVGVLVVVGLRCFDRSRTREGTWRGRRESR